MKDVITKKGIEGKKRHSLATCEKSTRENELAFTWDCDEQSKWGGREGGWESREKIFRGKVT